MQIIPTELRDSRPDNPAGHSKATVITPTPQPKGDADQDALTEEEERELAELMDGDD